MSSANAGLMDWFKDLSVITGMGSTTTTAPNVTIGNTATVVENITFQGDPSVTLSEALQTPIILTFLAMDTDGISDIDNGSAQLNVSLDGAETRWNYSAVPYGCFPETVGSNATAQNYSCTVTMEYWDLQGHWTCEAQAGDTKTNTSFLVSNCFTVGTTTAINMTATNVTWSTLAVNQLNTLMSTEELNITNTGNVNLTNITLRAQDLIGEITLTEYIGAENSTAPWGERACDTGQYLQNNTNLQILGNAAPTGAGALDFGPGSLVTTNNATHFCFEEVGAALVQQAYSTYGVGDPNNRWWTITGGTGVI